MATKIDQQIVNYEVVAPEPPAEAAEPPQAPAAAEVIRMTEKVERPEGLDCLEGATYKIRTPLDEHALYVTINDIVLNPGTPHQKRRPFEIFINSKNMDHFQWIVALTRLMSAVFRKGGDVAFICEELQAVFDPRGGYFKSGGKFMPSLVAEIGAVVEHHLRRIGLIHEESMGHERQRMLAEKRAAAAARDGAEAIEGYPPSARLCFKCNTRAMVVMDGCQTCLACGYSKCG